MGGGEGLEVHAIVLTACSEPNLLKNTLTSAERDTVDKKRRGQTAIYGYDVRI
jgi:hypothetical protein